MNKKLVISISLIVCAILIIVAVDLLLNDKNSTKSEKEIEETKKISFQQVKSEFEGDLEELKDGKYDNLIYNEFISSIDNVEGVYNIEILTDNAYQDRTFLENFEIMDEIIDKFFVEGIDKTDIVVDFYISDKETEYVYYNDIRTQCIDEKYNQPKGEYMFMNNGDNMVQICESLNNVWFSKIELNGNIGPFQSNYKKVYYYVSGIRPVTEAGIELKDGVMKLSEMENTVLTFLNENFILPVSEGISFGIGEAKILDYGDYEGICFKVRRIYKGMPFEYGQAASTGIYIDSIGSDTGEISYAYSTSPDTMLAFGRVDGTVVETENITEMYGLGDALGILSKEIGENSVYDVYGVELVYRNCVIPEERYLEVDDILEPKWKFMTKNQNDKKFTIFYVDVVTGEITERFEYYYD